MSKWWWLSFADPDTGKSLGVCIVDGDTFPAAVDTAWAFECNPGGQIMANLLDEEPAEQHVWRLIPPDEARGLEWWAS